MNGETVLLRELAAPAIIIERGSQTITGVNDAFCSLFNYDRGYIVGRHLRELVPEYARGDHDDLVERWFSSPRARLMGSSRSRVKIRVAGGRDVPVLVGLSKCTSIDGAVAVIVPRMMSSGLADQGITLGWMLVASGLFAVGAFNEVLADLKVAGSILIGAMVSRVQRWGGHAKKD